MTDLANEAVAPRMGMSTVLAALAAIPAALLAAAPFMTPSAAEPPSPMAAGLLARPGATAYKASPEQSAQRFAAEDGSLRFTLDRSGPLPLLHFEGQSEILALRSTAGPRGDEFLKTDTGVLMLRVSALGGMTVYPHAGSAGLAVTALGEGKTFASPASPAGGLGARLTQLSSETSRTLGRSVAFEAQAFPPAISAVAADAAERAAEALMRSENAQVSRVIIIPGAAPDVSRQAGVLRVTVAPPLGYAGRPSTAALAAAAR
jgi:hypothetical protein